MQSPKNFAAKEKVINAIYAGIVVMLVVFAISLLLPKEWLVSGKIVVFPSGQPASASANLLPETRNTAEIIKSETFQKNNFGDLAVKFAGVKTVKNSSIVRVKFRSSEADIQATEDLIVKIPAQVNGYARDLYEGSPFKYKMVSDPEISASPVKPNLLLNAILGFVAGVVLYLIYWYAVDVKKISFKKADSKKTEKSAIVSPEIKQEKSAGEKIGEGKVVMENDRPHFAPGKGGGTNSSAPENLPFVDEQTPSSPIEEPSDEEVKERLNRLMRGEL